VSAVLEAAGRLTDALEQAGFDYALSGAIALAYWSTPRATVDIDLAVDADAARLPELFDTLAAAGCSIDPERAMASAQRGDFGGRIDGIRVDVFLPVLALSAAAIERRVRVPFGRREAWILSAEDLALFKLIFGRTRDFADIERLLAAQRDRLDFEYMERWVSSIFVSDDPRATRFRDLCRLARSEAGG
jgi:hypothetical protein